MKKFLLSFLMILLAFVGICQTPCISSFDVTKNGNGGTGSGSFIGYGTQGANSLYKKSGEVKLRFATPLGSGINAPEIQNVTGPLPATTVIDFKFYPISIAADRMSIVYAFYSKTSGGGGNLENGSGSTYNFVIKYFDLPAQTCTNVVESPEEILPVTFSVFTAERKTSSSVSLKWTTASEQNNKGFYVQRNSGNGWKDVGFVFSQADYGNSSTDLSYEFKDVNSEKGITQYRLLQVDIDGKGKYSEIRAIRGEGAASKVVVYPNPSSDGKVNVVFEDNSLRDVLIIDMQGKTVKQYNEVAGNVLVVDKLTSGFYTMKIVNRKTAAIAVEKVVIK